MCSIKMGVTDEYYVMSGGVEVYILTGCSTWQFSVDRKKESELSASERKKKNENSQISWWPGNALDLYSGGNRLE
jgi:hypothetical protein